MRYLSTPIVTVLGALALAAFATPAALAGNGNGNGGGHGSPAPGPPETTIVSGPTRLAPEDYPAAAEGAAGAAVGAGPASAGDCGACIVTCWTATARSGSWDWSGHVYIFQHLLWCGNGAVVSYGSVSQSYEQSGWYILTGEYGPWWSSGCIGCGSLRASGYILWNWSAPLIGLNHSGTSWLNSTMYAYGGLSV
jgi:hypothetical protein